MLTSCGCNMRNEKASIVTMGEENTWRTHILFFSVLALGLTQSILFSTHWPEPVSRALTERQLGDVSGTMGEQ